jgi:hypothetical protein
VRAAAEPFEHVGTFTVLNGAEGVTGALAAIIKQAGLLAGMARETLVPAALPQNGHRDGGDRDAVVPGTVTGVPRRRRTRPAGDGADATRDAAGDDADRASR